MSLQARLKAALNNHQQSNPDKCVGDKVVESCMKISLSSTEVQAMLDLYADRQPEFTYPCNDMRDIVAILIKMPANGHLSDELRSQMLTVCRQAISRQNQTDKDLREVRRQNDDLREFAGLPRTCG